MAATTKVALRTIAPTAIVIFSTILITACEPDAFAPDRLEPGDVPSDIPVELTEPASSGVVWLGAGDIATCTGSGDDETADLLDSLLVAHPTATVFTAGDNVYDDGTAQEYADCYDPTWGRFKDRTWATIGNHEYTLGNADPTFDYFGARVGPRDLGYYSVDEGNWHIVMLNTGATSIVPVSPGSPQEQWLRADLAATTKSCVMAVFHHARFTSCQSSKPDCTFVEDKTKPLWDALYEYGAELIVVGHKHHYERFALQDPDGNADPVSGIRQIIVGTGGKSVGVRDVIAPNSEARNDETSAYGVLKLTLHDNSYDWEFVPAAGVTFTDSGSGICTGNGPVADFTWVEGPPLTVAFTDASTDSDGTVTGWSWDFGDGTGTSTLQNPTYTYATAGSYDVTLTVTDNDGLTGTTTKTVPAGPQAPTADFTYVATELTAAFTDASTDSDGTVTGWSWDFGDGTTSTLQNPSHTYAVSGSYTAMLTVTDNDGETDTTSQTLKVAGPAPGQVLYFTASNSSGTVGGVDFKDEDIIAYDVSTDTWSMFFDGGDVGLSGSNDRDMTAFTLLANGDILFSVRAATTIPNVGSVTPADIIRFTGTTGPNTSGTFSFYLAGANAGLAGENIDAIGFAPDGRLVVSLAGTFSAPGGFVQDEDLIAHEGGASWSLYFDGSDVFLDDSPDEDVAGVSFDDATGDIYLTTLGPFAVRGVSGDASDIFVCTPGSLGDTTSCTFASYFVGSLHGLTGIEVIGVHVGGSSPPSNNPPTADFSFTTTDLRADFTDASTDPDGTLVSWSWNFGDGATSTLQNPSHTYAAAGTYTVSLTATDNDGATDVATKPVTVTAAANQAPTADFTFTTTDLRADFTDASTDPDGTLVSWSWNFGDGATSTLQNPSHTYAAAGTYTVSLTATDNDGATDVATKPVTVTASGGGDIIYISSASPGIAGGVSFDDEDILAYDTGTGTWSMYFDGSDVGLGGSWTRDVDAFSVLPNGDILLSFRGATTIPNVGNVADSDIVRFTGSTGPNTAGTFSFYLVGADVGLTTGSHDIDAIDFAPNGRLVISTAGTLKGITTGSAYDEDLIILDEGGKSWSLYFDGSDVALDSSSEDVTAVWIDEATGDIYLNTLGAFDVAGVSGVESDIFVCTPGSLGATTSCTFSSYWVGSLHGFAGQNIDGIQIVR